MLLPFRSRRSAAVTTTSEPSPVVVIVVLFADVDVTVEPFSVSVLL